MVLLTVLTLTAVLPPGGQNNQLLLAMPGAESRRVVPRLQPVDLTIGQVLHQSREPLRFGWVPTTALVVVEYEFDSGMTAEMVIELR